MDFERAILEILLRKIRPEQISLHVVRGKNHYKGVEKKTFLQAARWMPDCTEDENEQLYEWTRTQLDTSAGIFDLIEKVARVFLEIRAGSFYYRADNWTERSQFFHWKEMVIGLGQDIFLMALLAKEHVEKAEQLSDFLCIPFPQIGDVKLKELLRPESHKDGPAENHFHLKGSFPVFLLNWTCLMNHVGDGIDFFHRMKEYREEERLTEEAEISRRKRKNWFSDAMTAAGYRLHLFEVYSGIAEDGRLAFDWENGPDETELGMFRSRIEYYRDGMEPKWCQKQGPGRKPGEWVYGLDYALAEQWDICYDRDEVSIVGERYFLYRCFAEIFRPDSCFRAEERNLFYRYLLIALRMRAEMVQVNRMRGFGNFAAYQDRKEDVIDHYPAYQSHVIRLTGCSLRRQQKLSSMEMRITPKDTAYETLNRIAEYQEELEKNAPEESFGLYFYVLHFPKEREREPAEFGARNGGLRKRMERHIAEQKQLIRMEQSHYRTGQAQSRPRVRGYDTCSGEIGCRPEVFACFYRSIQVFAGENQVDWIHWTYHVGEDFLDLVDGLRAVDEAVRFCELPRGSRLGHGMALGLNAVRYYQIKQYKILLPAQDLLDNIVWTLGFCQERGIVIDPALQRRLESAFMDLHGKLYGNVLPGETVECGADECLNSGADQEKRRRSSDLREGMAEKETALTVAGVHNRINAEAERYRDKTKDGGQAVTDWRLYYGAWQLRGDKPELYLEYEEPVDRPVFEGALRKGLEQIRANQTCRNYYKYYHFNRRVREKGERPEVFTLDDTYITLIGRMQEELRYMLTEQGIGIECNPTSNYKIGPFYRFDEHPMLRMYGKNLEEGAASRMCISINTDDMGLFQTSLETEYAAMYVALRKYKNGNGQCRYSREAVLKWLEDVKKSGRRQAFLMGPETGQAFETGKGAEKDA